MAASQSASGMVSKRPPLSAALFDEAVDPTERGNGFLGEARRRLGNVGGRGDPSPPAARIASRVAAESAMAGATTRPASVAGARRAAESAARGA